MFKNEFIPEEPLFSNSGMHLKEGSVDGWFHRKEEEFVDKECITGSSQNILITFRRSSTAYSGRQSS